MFLYVFSFRRLSDTESVSDFEIDPMYSNNSSSSSSSNNNNNNNINNNNNNNDISEFFEI